ncbi:MAG: ABC transporter ATP-binding protein [Candidatus Methylomirabilia bacterium]
MTEARQGNLRRHRALLPYLSALAGIMGSKAVLALGVMVSLSLTEGAGVLLLVPLLQLVGLEVGQGALGRIAQVLSSVFAAFGVRPTLITVLGLFVLVISARGLLQRWQTTLSLALQHEVSKSLRQRLYRAIANSNWLFFSRSRASDFTHVLTTEVERVGDATSQLLHLFATALVALAYVGLAVGLSPVMTGLVFACAAGLMLVLRGKTEAARAAGEALTEAMQHLYGAVTEHLGAMKTAKSYGAEERHAGIFARLTERVRRINTRAVRSQAEAQYWFDSGSVLLLSFILYVAFEILALPTATGLVLLFLFARLMPRFSALLGGYQEFVNLLPAFDSVMSMQARCEAAAEPRVDRVEPCALREAIRLERVSFVYDRTPAVRDIQLALHAGQTTAIVGPSGAGKSTVADLIIGLLSPTEGRVLVDGTPLGPERMRAWRDRIGYVAQESFLFHDTIRANLLWARPQATEQEVLHALRLAAAEEFVGKLPDGLGTVVGDRGVRLSGGERQRLALARALLRKPSLLILDEATSALDSENERRIQQAIQVLHGEMTIVVISHRLSTVRWADLIYVLEDGRLVESGSWDELTVRETGRFRAWCIAQGIEGVPGLSLPVGELFPP